jgi:hypothetical protein
MSRKGAWFLHLGLACALAGLFVSSNFIKLASLAFCALYAYRPGGPRPGSRWLRIENLLWVPIAIGASRLHVHGPANAFRDLAFFLIPPVYFAVGRRFQAEEGDVEALVLRYSGWYCLVFLVGAAYQWFSRGSIDVTVVRDSVSPGSFLLVLCIFLLVRSRESWRGLLSTPLFLLSAFVFVAQFSRTYALALAALLVTPREFRVSGKAIARTVGALTALVGVVALLDLSGAVTDLALKWIDELAFQDVWTADDLGTRYRAYESFAAFTVFASFSPVQMAFGAGFGLVVDLGVPVFLAGKDYDAVPWIHNGYLYVLVKTGLVGLASYLLFLARMAVGPYPSTSALGSAIVRGTAVGLLLSNVVVCGWFNIESVFAYLLLGYMFAIRVKSPRPDEAGSRSAEPVLAGRTST